MLEYHFKYLCTQSFDVNNLIYELSKIVIDIEAAIIMSKCYNDTAGSRNIARRYYYKCQHTVFFKQKFEWICKRGDRF